MVRPSLSDDQPVGKTRYLFKRMADVEDREWRFVTQPFEVGKDIVLSWRIQRSERLIQQQNVRAGEERAAERDTAFLAARQAIRFASKQRSDPKQIDDTGDVRFRCPVLRTPPPEAQVSIHRHMRKETGVLEHISDPPLLCGQGYAAGAVEQASTIEEDATAIRTQEPSDSVGDCCLAGTGGTEQRRDTALFDAESDIELELRKAMLELDL